MKQVILVTPDSSHKHPNMFRETKTFTEKVTSDHLALKGLHHTHPTGLEKALLPKTLSMSSRGQEGEFAEPHCHPANGLWIGAPLQLSFLLSPESSGK